MPVPLRVPMPRPQKSLLYRLIVGLNRMRLQTILARARHPHRIAGLFLLVEGAAALGIIGWAASAFKLPLLFPQLGPSAFIIFHTPMAESASPRSLILSHGISLVIGLLVLRVFAVFLPEAGLLETTLLNGPRIATVSIAMGLASIAMLMLRCAHPPAAATALLAAMGYAGTSHQIFGLTCAVVLLAAQALLFNRLVGGLPYPLWRADPHTVREFNRQAVLGDADVTFWRMLSARIVMRRR